MKLNLMDYLIPIIMASLITYVLVDSSSKEPQKPIEPEYIKKVYSIAYVDGGNTMINLVLNKINNGKNASAAMFEAQKSKDSLAFSNLIDSIYSK